MAPNEKQVNDELKMDKVEVTNLPEETEQETAGVGNPTQSDSLPGSNDNKSKITNITLPTPFLQNNAHEEVVRLRNGAVVKGWLKECNIKCYNKTADWSREYFIEYLGNVAASNSPLQNSVTSDRYALHPKVIKELIVYLTDDAVVKELSARGASIAGTPEKRKNKLTGLFIDLYGANKSPVKNKNAKKGKHGKKGKTKLGQNRKDDYTSTEPVGAQPGPGIKTTIIKQTPESHDINATILSVVESPLKTLENCMLKLDDRLLKQESMVAALSKKMDAIIQNPLKNNTEIAERFHLLEENDKTLFINIKALHTDSQRCSEETLNKFNSIAQTVDRLESLVNISPKPVLCSCHCDAEKSRDLKMNSPLKTATICRSQDADSQRETVTNEILTHDETGPFTVDIGVQTETLRNSLSTSPSTTVSCAQTETTVYEIATQTEEMIPHSLDSDNETADMEEPSVDDIERITFGLQELIKSVKDKEKMIIDQLIDLTYEPNQNDTINCLQQLLSSVRDKEKTMSQEVESNHDETIHKCSSSTTLNSEILEVNAEPTASIIDQPPSDAEGNLHEASPDGTDKPQQTSRTKSRHEYQRKKKVLLVYDTYHEDFDQRKFSRSYDIKKVHYSSVSDLVEKRKLMSEIKSFNPEIIFIHLGINDIKRGLTFPTFIRNFKSILRSALEETNCKICYSLIIPTPGNPNLNTKIQAANKYMGDFIKWLREENYYEDRICTVGNDNLSGYLERYVTKDGEALRLSPRGLAKLWLRFRDALNRTSSLTRQTLHEFTRSNDHNE